MTGSIVPNRFSAVRAAKLAVANLLQIHLVDGTAFVSEENTQKQGDAILREVTKIAERLERSVVPKKT
ncbi:hypothetical protein [Polaromonas aquatica]|uniref:Uncharacterized protein n=1 Tax=Polaromonas aquatica TaxID=332657 RepID=A0ABW1TU60_9BURK